MSEDDKQLPKKLDVARALMLKGSLFVHLDPRLDEVSVPPWLKKQPQLVLQVGLELALPIPDLVVDEEGVSATLSFNRSPYRCSVPWASVFALVGDDGRGLVWPESMPVEIAAEVDREAQRRGGGKPEGEAGGKVERIVGKAVREDSRKPSGPAIVRSGGKLRRGARTKGATDRDADVVHLEPKSSAPNLQLIKGKKAGSALKRRKGSHLRVVK